MATNQSRVELIVDAVKALNPLRAVKRASNKAEEAIDRLRAAAKKTGSTLEDLGRKGKRGLGQLAAAAGQAAAKFGKLGKAAIIAAAVAGSAALAKFSFGAAGELERQTKSLQVLTGSLETAKGIIAELQAFGAVTPFTSQELIETSKRLKAFGFETEQIVDVTKRLADVAGATGADLGGIATAFGQIQAKGRLQTEELLQLQERGVGIADELQKMYGMTGEQFSKALEKGQISAKAAEVALIRLTDTGGKYANGAIAQSDTLFGKLSTLQDALQRFGQNIGKVLSPIFKGIIDFLTTITNQINNLFREAAITNQARKNLGVQGRLTRQEKEQLQAEKDRLRAAGFGTTTTAPTAPDLTTPELLKGRAGADAAESKFVMPGFAGTGMDPGLTAEQAFASQVEQIAKGNMLLQARLEDGEREERQRQAIASIIEQSGFVDKERIESARQTLETIFNQTSALEDQLTASQKLEAQQKKAAEKMQALYSDIGMTIKDGVVGAIKGAIDGTKSLKEVAVGILDSLMTKLLDFLVTAALFGVGGIGSGGGLFGGLFKFGGGQAKGGPVSAGTSYIVGEKGPEMFTPSRSGTIIPNNAMGGATINVSVDASGTRAEGDTSEQKRLGEAIGVAIRQELIKQKRPGGLLS